MKEPQELSEYRFHRQKSLRLCYLLTSLFFKLSLPLLDYLILEHEGYGEANSALKLNIVLIRFQQIEHIWLPSHNLCDFVEEFLLLLIKSSQV